MKYQCELDDLLQKGLKEVFKLIEAKGKESKHSPIQCLQIDSNSICINVNTGFISEFSDEGLIDNEGYQYSFFSITTDELCQLIDHLIETYK